MDELYRDTTIHAAVYKSPRSSGIESAQTMVAQRRQLQQGNADGTVAILIIVILVFLIIWAPSTIRKCRNRMSGESAVEEDPSRNRLADAYVEAVIIRRLAELNRFREQHVQHHSLSEADRREYIRNVLLSRKLVIDASVRSDVTLDGRSPSSHPKADDPSYHLKPDSKAETSEDDENCCPICLNEYKNGDEVCLSNNKFCNHFFHKDCISEWLVTHEECPCCRHLFLFFVENESDLEMYERRPHRQSATVAAPAMAPFSPIVSIGERAGAAAEEDQPQTPDLNAAEEHSDHLRVTFADDGSALHEPQLQPSPSPTTFRGFTAINPDALPNESAALVARGMNTRDNLHAGDGLDSVGVVEGLSVGPVPNLDVPVAHADAHRERSVRPADQTIDV